MATKRAVGIWNASCVCVRSVLGHSGEMKRNGETRKVLLIDDDDELAEVLRQVLRDAGHSVATVRHGAAALELTQHTSPDLILLDLSMPIMDGWSFVAQYRRSAKQGARI
ncbi:MAG: response regulator, partial [Chloroflexi bacterium]